MDATWLVFVLIVVWVQRSEIREWCAGFWQEIAQ